MTFKHKAFLSGLLLLHFFTMFLSWFGGARGVQEIQGLMILRNPLAGICLILALAGLWIPLKKHPYIMAVMGLCGLCSIEIYYFFTWYLKTIHSHFRLSTCFSMAYPEFYLGFGLALAALICTAFFYKKHKSTR